MVLDDPWDESMPHTSVPYWHSPMAQANAEHDAAQTLVSLGKSKSMSISKPQAPDIIERTEGKRIATPVWRVPIKVC